MKIIKPTPGSVLVCLMGLFITALMFTYSSPLRASDQSMVSKEEPVMKLFLDNNLLNHKTESQTVINEYISEGVLKYELIGQDQVKTADVSIVIVRNGRGIVDLHDKDLSPTDGLKAKMIFESLKSGDNLVVTVKHAGEPLFIENLKITN